MVVAEARTEWQAVVVAVLEQQDIETIEKSNPKTLIGESELIYNNNYISYIVLIPLCSVVPTITPGMIMPASPHVT